MVSGKKKLLYRALALTLATGVFSCFSGVAEAGEIVNIDSVVDGTVYGNGSGENHTVVPSPYADHSDFCVNIEGGSVQNVFGAYFDGSDSANYTLNNNVINIFEGYVDNEIISAYNGTRHGWGLANDNGIKLFNVNLDNISQIKAAHIYGSGQASGNYIEIQNTNISNTNSEIIGAVINPDATGPGSIGRISADASGSNISISTSNVGKIEGGKIGIQYDDSDPLYPKTESVDVQALGNSIFLDFSSSNTIIGGHIESRGGAYVNVDRKFTATASGNNITIVRSSVNDVPYTDYGIVGGLIAVQDTSNISTEATNILSASDNIIDVKDSIIHSSIVGGKAFTNSFINAVTSGKINMRADDNEIKISENTIIDSEILGGDVGVNITGNSNGNIEASSLNNSILINDGTVKSDIFGGRVKVGNSIVDGRSSTDNTVGIDVSHNAVKISGGNVTNSVFGGYVSEVFNTGNNNVNANVVGNIVEVSGGNVNGDVIAGQLNRADVSKYTVKDNSVIWRGGTIDGNIIGDDILRNGISSWNADDTNSSFNFYASASNSNKTIAGISNFKNYNFYIDNTVAPDSTLITVNNTVDMSKSNIGVAMTSDAALNLGDSVKLLSTQGLITKENLENYLSGSGLGRAGGENIYDVYDFALGNDGYNLTATVENRSSNPKSEEIPESRQPEVTIVDDKLDIVDTAYNMSIGVVEPVSFYDMNHTNVTKGNMTMRSNDMVIGSTSTKGDEEKNNTITQGPFFEYGTGSFIGKNFYSTGGVEGSGSSKKYGIGYLLRQVKFGRHHFDAYVRTGRINNEFRSYMTGVGSVNYNNTDTYYAAHFGYGQYLPIDPHTKMDVYGKYFYKIIPGSSTTTHVNDTDIIKTKFEPIVSHKFRIGSKITWDYMEEKKKMMFVDLALEHELSHTQTTILGGREISNSSGADTTGVLELGYRQVFGPKDAFLFTADLQGYVGTRKGIGGNIGVRFNF